MKQVVLITGGTQGIGLGLAKAFMATGAEVAVCGRSDGTLDAFSRDFPVALAIKADVTMAQDRAAMLEAVSERFGRIDVLVNSAGRFVERNFLAPDAAVGLEDEVALNLTAPIQLTSEVLERWPALQSIIFVSSGFALVSPARAPTYGAVKAGLHGFAEGLRRQLAPPWNAHPRTASHHDGYTGNCIRNAQENDHGRGGQDHAGSLGEEEANGATGADEAASNVAADRT